MNIKEELVKFDGLMSNGISKENDTLITDQCNKILTHLKGGALVSVDDLKDLPERALTNLVTCTCAMTLSMMHDWPADGVERGPYGEQSHTR